MAELTNVKMKPKLLSLLSRRGVLDSDECLNCAKPFLDNGIKKQKITELLIPKIGTRNKELEIVSLYNVLKFIFKLPVTPNWPGESPVAICDKCSQVLVQTYTAHLELMELSHINSILNLMLEDQGWRNHDLPPDRTPDLNTTGIRGSQHPDTQANDPLHGSSILAIKTDPSPPDSRVVNMIPLEIMEENSDRRMVARPIVTKRIKQALLSTDPSTQSVIIFETNEPMGNPPTAKRRMLVPTEFYDFSRTHACPECGESFLQRTSLEFHIHWIHNGETKYLCNLCLQPLPTDEKLLEHMSTLHVGSQEADYTVLATNNDKKKQSRRSTKKTSPKKPITETRVVADSGFPQLPLDLRSLLEDRARPIFPTKSPVLPQRRKTIQTDGVSMRSEATPAVHTDFICSICTRIFPTVSQRDGHFLKCSQQAKRPYDPMSLVPAQNRSPSPKPSTSKGKQACDDEELNEDSDECRFVIVESTKKRKATQRRLKPAHDSKAATAVNLTGFICSSCGRIFPSNNGRNEHMRTCNLVEQSNSPNSTHGDNVKVHCPYEKCSRNRTTFLRSVLYRHIETTHPEKNNPMNRSELEELLRVSDKRRSEARTKSTASSSVSRPIPTFSGTCYCGERLCRVSRTDVENHIKMDHNTQAVFLCSMCERSYEPVGSAGYKKHVLSHATHNDGAVEEKFLRTECGLKLARDVVVS